MRESGVVASPQVVAGAGLGIRDSRWHVINDELQLTFALAMFVGDGDNAPTYGTEAYADGDDCKQRQDPMVIEV